MTPWGRKLRTRFLPLVCAVMSAFAGCADEKPRGATADTPSDDRSAATAEQVGETALHALHATGEEPAACDACHEVLSGQYQRAKSWRCEKCHEQARLVLHAAATPESGARECWSCHDFGAKEKDPKGCATCHGQQQGTLAAVAPHDPKQPNEDCGSCHRAHETPSLAATKCESCHDKEEVSGHDKPDIQITGCASCHGYHEVAATSSKRCTNCHRQSRAQVSVNATFEKGHEKCVSCHRQHRFFKTEVLGCTAECHEGVVAISEAKVKEHRGCIGCHDNHDVRNAPQESCAKCHDKKINPRHPKDKTSGSSCIGCHKPHAGPGAPLAAACSSCHAKATTDGAFHQSAANRGPACRDCHKPHSFALKGAGPTLCLGCHGAKPFKNAKQVQVHTKHSECVRCHSEKVAHTPAGPRAACASCHEEKAAIARKDHKKCVNCHDPHSTKQKKPCGGCHTEQGKIARKEHKNCIGCHEPHSTEQKKPCAGCHAEQFKTAPEKHKDCRQCHDQHSTLVKKPCASCHEDRATGVHAPVKGGCVMCHRPHGPNGNVKPPACKSCHKQDLPALHQNKAHQDCSKCHKSHGEQPYRDRARCLSCHKDKRGHEPTAPLCIGCHPFGESQ